MSKRSERREADRLARKAAFQQSRAQRSVSEQILTAELTAAEPESDLLAKAQAFFQRSEPAVAPIAKPEPKPASSAQLAANQANAQLSTGPRTLHGKSISSRNNTRHGLATTGDGDNFRVLATENQAAYDRDLADFRREWHPNTATENDLVNRLVMHRWLRLRAQRLQESLFDDQTGELTDTKKFELYRRYEAHHERGYNKAFSDLMRLRAFQLRQQNGFESQRRKNEEHEFKIKRLKRQDEAQTLKLLAAQARRSPQPTSETAVKEPRP